MNFADALRKDIFARTDSHNMVLAEVAKNGMLLKKVKYQSFAICKAAIQQNWRAVQFVRDLNPFLVQEAILSDLEAASLLPPQAHLTAVKTDVRCFDFIEKPSMECCRHVIHAMPEWITKRPNPPLELCIIAIRQRFKDAYLMARVNQDISAFMQYISRDYLEGMPITEDLQRAALSITKGYAILRYPVDVKMRMAEEALRINPYLFPFLPPQTQTVSQQVCESLPKMLAYVKAPTRDLIWSVAMKWPLAIKYAEEQDEELCIHAVQCFPTAIANVRTNRISIWKKAGHSMPPSLLTLFPEFANQIQQSANAAALFQRIQRAMMQEPKKFEEPLEDPITLEVVESGTVCGFVQDEKGQLHFAGTLDTLLDILRVGFKNSTVQNLFIPMKNSLVPTQRIYWRTVL